MINLGNTNATQILPENLEPKFGNTFGVLVASGCLGIAVADVHLGE